MKKLNKADVNPVGGVILTNNATWLNDELYNAIDLTFENYMLERPDDIDVDEWDSMYIEDEAAYLIGFKKVHDGVYENVTYEIDEDAEYSAILSFPYTQVVQSKYLSYCNICSPCFPLQNNLDEKGIYETYQLPPDLFDDNDDHLEILEIVD